jgi:hypothetical protein
MFAASKYAKIAAAPNFRYNRRETGVIWKPAGMFPVFSAPADRLRAFEFGMSLRFAV